MPLNTKKWKLRQTGEPVAHMRFSTTITAATLVCYAANDFEVSEDGERLVGYSDGRRITRASLERAIAQDMKNNGFERMDWDYDDDTFEVARAEVKRLYPEWAEWIDKAQ